MNESKAGQQTDRDRQVDRERLTEGQKDRQTDGQRDRRTDGQTDTGWMNESKAGQTDGWTETGRWLGGQREDRRTDR